MIRESAEKSLPQQLTFAGDRESHHCRRCRGNCITHPGHATDTDFIVMPPFRGLRAGRKFIRSGPEARKVCVRQSSAEARRAGRCKALRRWRRYSSSRSGNAADACPPVRPEGLWAARNPMRYVGFGPHRKSRKPAAECEVILTRILREDVKGIDPDPAASRQAPFLSGHFYRDRVVSLGKPIDTVNLRLGDIG